MKKGILGILLVISVLLLGVAWLFGSYKNIHIPKQIHGTPDTGVFVGKNPEFSELKIFAEGIVNARTLIFAPGGALMVSQLSEGLVVLLPDDNNDGKADTVIPVVRGLNRPHGLEFRCSNVNTPNTCTLYVADEEALYSFEYDGDIRKARNQKKLLDLPHGSLSTHHTRSLLFMPSPNEDTLLISVGSSCNVCNEQDSRRASIISYDIVTGKSETFAKGLRNSVFLTIHPVTGAIWGTEMGRDKLGDDIPPDEINIIEKGKNYGWPICYGKNIHDTEFDKNIYVRNPCQSPFETPSHIDLQAHSAPLGLAFIPEEGWPEEYWHNLLVAYHGSWNRSVPTGYKIVRIKLDREGQYLDIEDFITGWLNSDGTKNGRPVDIKILPGGTIFISDDAAGIIYQLNTNR